MTPASPALPPHPGSRRPQTRAAPQPQVLPVSKSLAKKKFYPHPTLPLKTLHLYLNPKLHPWSQDIWVPSTFSQHDRGGRCRREELLRVVGHSCKVPQLQHPPVRGSRKSRDAWRDEIPAQNGNRVPSPAISTWFG